MTPADEATLRTEETWTLRLTTGGLLVPYLDPRGGAETTWHYAIASAAGAWTIDHTVLPTPEHVMGATETPGNLWLAGASYGSNPAVGGVATVWRSTDGGATWAASLAVDNGVDNTGFARFYTVVPLGTELIAVLSDTGGVTHRWRWTGSAWTDLGAGGATLTDYVLFTYNGSAFALVWHGGKEAAAVTAGAWEILTNTADAAAGAGITASLPNVSILDASATATHLYLLDETGLLHRGDTNGVWRTSISVDPAARSIAVDEAGGWLFVGTTDSRVIRYRLNATP